MSNLSRQELDEFHLFMRTSCKRAELGLLAASLQGRTVKHILLVVRFTSGSQTRTQTTRELKGETRRTTTQQQRLTWRTGTQTMVPRLTKITDSLYDKTGKRFDEKRAEGWNDREENNTHGRIVPLEMT